MSNELALVLHLLGCSAQNTPPHAPIEPVDWSKVFSCAKEQGVPILVADALLKAPYLGYPADIGKYAQFLCCQLVQRESYRKELVLKLLDSFEQANVPVAVLKGYAVACLYHNPNCRISGDVDLLVAPKDERAALKLLEKQGFELMQRAVYSHHTEAHHKEIGIAELHTSLYEDAIENVWFSGVLTFDKLQENYVFDDGIPSLGYTDHMIFLSLHAMKHFINGGLSLRMIMDIGLYYSRHEQDMDTGRFWQVLEQLKFTKTIKVFFSILARYCDMNFALEDEPLMLRVLDDLERGGAFGKKDRNTGLASGKVFHDKATPAADYCQTKKKKQATYWLRRFFPTYITLKAEYPILKRISLLYPFVWVVRLIKHSYRFVFYRAKKIPTATVDVRGELLKELGLY